MDDLDQMLRLEEGASQDGWIDDLSDLKLTDIRPIQDRT